MKDRDRPIWGFILLALACLPLQAQNPEAEQLEALKKEIQELKAGQIAIQNDLQEIKRLLSSRQPAEPAREAVVDLAGKPFKGPADARLVMVEFSDYQCPYCFRHVEQTSPQIDHDFVESGKMTRYFFDMPLESIHKNAFGAALAANCAEKQGRFWEMHDKLFANHAALAPENLPKYASEVGLNLDAFQACLADVSIAKRVRADMSTAARIGAQGTPNFWIGFRDDKNPSKVKLVRNIRGARAYADFKTVIESLLEDASKTEGR